MSALAASSLVANMPSEILRRTDSIKFVLECSNQTLNDKKFWKVRYVLCDPLDIRACCHSKYSHFFTACRLAGLELLLSLVSRVGNQKMSSTDSEKQLIMEAIRKCCPNCHLSVKNSMLTLFMDLSVPYKEVIHNVARKSLADSESQVTATASKINQTMAWWP